MTTNVEPSPHTITRERADLLETLAKHRYLLRLTARGLTDQQARQRSTISELCIGGLIKHLTKAERNWANFIEHGATAKLSGAGDLDAAAAAHTAGFQMREDETLAGLLERYDDVAGHTTELVKTLPDLDLSHPLPEAPWFEPGACWSARRVLLHIIAETAQHAGHADIIREAIDGSKSMG